MNIQWLGHSCFLITSDKGTRIITDPYTPNERLTYGTVQEAADVVLVSHGHGDHNNVAAVLGQPQIVKEAGRHQAAGIEIQGIPAFHDPTQGSQRGGNIIFTFSVDGLRLCHMGDLGHPLSPQQIQEMGAIDVLFLPVGGTYTIDAAAASQLCDQVQPRVVIPMHYRTEKVVGLPIVGVDDFLALRTQVRRAGSTQVALQPDQLPTTTETIVLDPAR